MTLRQFHCRLIGRYVLGSRKPDGKAGEVPKWHLYLSMQRLSSDMAATLTAMMDPNLAGCAFEDEQARYYIVDPRQPNIEDMMVEADQYKKGEQHEETLYRV